MRRFPESAVKVRETTLSHGLSAVAAPVKAVYRALRGGQRSYYRLRALAEDDCMM